MDLTAVRSAAAMLLDTERRAEWPAAEAVLRQAGPAAYGSLVAVVAVGAGESVARAGALLGFDEVTDDARETAVKLRSPNPDERFDAAHSLTYLSTEPLPAWARMLTTLLADPTPKVSRMAVSVMVGLGRDVLPLLREVRRSSLPERRGALTAIAEFGWDEIDPADRRALARLVAVKQAVEVPEPVAFDREWYAVRAGDRAAVLAAFDLSDPAPVTMRGGFAVGRHDQLHQWGGRAMDYEHRGVARCS